MNISEKLTQQMLQEIVMAHYKTGKYAANIELKDFVAQIKQQIMMRCESSNVGGSS